MKAYILIADENGNYSAAPLKVFFTAPLDMSKKNLTGNVDGIHFGSLDDMELNELVPLVNFSDAGLWLESEIETNYKGK